MAPSLQSIVDAAPVFGWGTVVTFLFWAWRKSISISLMFSKQHEHGQKAMEQIDKMASNCFPTIQAGITDLNTKTVEANETLGRIKDGINLLVDRTTRNQ